MGKSMIADFLWKPLICLALAGLTLLVYSPCFHHPFIDYDDRDYVVLNPHVHAGLTVDGVGWAFTSFACGNWHPLTWLSLELDASLCGGVKPGCFHLTNLLLHTANTVLLFLVLSWLAGFLCRSAAVAALFALHPLHVESVAWVAERKDVLSTLFWMLTLAAYAWYIRRPGLGRYLLVLLPFGLGLLAKPMLVTLPFVLLLLDYWPLRRFDSPRPRGNLQLAILEKVPLLALALTSCLVTILAQLHGNAVASFERYSLTARLANALLAYVGYLARMAWPMHLAVYYPHPAATVSLARALAAGGLLAVLTLLVLGPGRRWPYLAVGWFWYLGTLVPVIGLVQVGGQALADRYTYVPLIGLFLGLTWGLADLFAARGWPRFYLVGGTALILGACAALTWIQVGYWQSDLRLWEHAVAVTDNNVLAHVNLGHYYLRERRPLAARKEFEEAVRIDPNVIEARVNLGAALADLGLSEQALAEYRRALAVEPNYSLTHDHLGNLFWHLGRLQEALSEYGRALDIEPRRAWTYINLGAVLGDLGRSEESLAAYRRAVSLAPGEPWAHEHLGMAFVERGQFNEAILQLRQAVALAPETPQPHAGLGWALQQTGRLSEAADAYREALALGDKQAETFLQGCEQLRDLRPRLAGLVAGKERPADNAERLAFAELCRQPWEQRYALSARLYREAFALDPKLANDRSAQNRFKAAAASAAAGCRLGHDAAGLDSKERSRLRGQALDWLREELAVWGQQAGLASPQARASTRRALRAWRYDSCLTGVREGAAPAKLTEAERLAWQKLWQEVSLVLSRASAPPGGLAPLAPISGERDRR
jgi:tetratricopeptide (TPR) repeat protein